MSVSLEIQALFIVHYPDRFLICLEGNYSVTPINWNLQS